MFKKALGFLIQKISNIGPLRNFIAYIFQRVFNNFIDREITLADFTNGICELNDIPLKVAEINSQFLLLQPYKLYSGKIRHLKISLPTVTQLASESIKIQIEGIHLVLIYNKISKTNATNLVTEQIRREEEEKLEEEQNQELKQEDDDEDQQDNFKKLVGNILQNLKYTVNEIVVQVLFLHPDSESLPQNYIQTQIQQVSYQMDETTNNTQLIKVSGLSLHVLKEQEYSQIKMQSYNDTSTIFAQENKDIQIKKINHNNGKSNIVISIPQLEMMIDPIQIKIISQFVIHTLEFQQTLSSIDSYQRKLRVDELKKREKFQEENNQIIDQSIYLNKDDSNDLFKSCSNLNLSLAKSLLSISRHKISSQKGLVGTFLKDFCKEVKEEQNDDDEKETNQNQKNIEFAKEVNILLESQEILKEESQQNKSDSKKKTIEIIKQVDEELEQSRILNQPQQEIEKKSIIELKNIDKDSLDVHLKSIIIYFPIGVSKYARIWNFQQVKEKYNAKIGSSFFCIKSKNIIIEISQGISKFNCGNLKIVQIQLSKNTNYKIKILSKDRIKELEKSNLYQSLNNESSLFQSMDESAFNKFSNKHLNEFNIQEQKEHQCYLKILSLKNKKYINFNSNRVGFCKYNIYEYGQSCEFQKDSQALFLEYSNDTINIELNYLNLYLTPIQTLLDLMSIMYPIEQYKNLLTQTKNFPKKYTSQPVTHQQQIQPVKINMMIGQIKILLSSNQTKSCNCSLIEDELQRKKVAGIQIIFDSFFFNLKIENSLKIIASFETLNVDMLRFGNNQQYSENKGFLIKSNILNIVSNQDGQKKYQSYCMFQYQTQDSIHMSVCLYPVVTVALGVLNLNLSKQILQVLSTLVNDLSSFFEIFQKKITFYDKQIIELNIQNCQNQKNQKSDKKIVDSEQLSDNELVDLPQISLGVNTNSFQQIDQVQIQVRIIINKIQVNIQLYTKIFQFVPNKIDMEKTYSNIGIQNLIEKFSENALDKNYTLSTKFNNDIQIILSNSMLIFNILNKIQQDTQIFQLQLGIYSINIEDYNQPDVFLGESKLNQKILLYKNSSDIQSEQKQQTQIISKSTFMFGQQDIQDETLLILFPPDLKYFIQDSANSVQFFMNIEILTQMVQTLNIQQNQSEISQPPNSIQSPIKIDSNQPQDMIKQWKENEDEDFSEYGDQVEEMNFYDAIEVNQQEQEITSYTINILKSKIKDLTVRLGDFKLEFLEKLKEFFNEQEVKKNQKSPDISLRIQLQLINLCVDIYPVLNHELRHSYDNPRHPIYEYEKNQINFAQNRGLIRLKNCEIDLKQEILTLDIQNIQFFFLVFQDLNPNINPITIINHPENMGFQKIIDVLAIQVIAGKKQDIIIQFQDEILVELCKDSIEGLCEFQFILSEILNHDKNEVQQQQKLKQQEDFCIISDTDNVQEKLNFFKHIYNDFSKSELLEYHNIKLDQTVQIELPTLKITIYRGQDFNFKQDIIEIKQDSKNNNYSPSRQNYNFSSNEIKLDKFIQIEDYFNKTKANHIIQDDKYRYKEESRDKNNFLYLEIRQNLFILSSSKDLIRVTGRVAEINLGLTKDKKYEKIFITENSQLSKGFLIDFLQNKNKIDLLLETPNDIQLNFNLKLKKFIDEFSNIKLEYKKLYRIEDEEVEIINKEDVIDPKLLKNKSKSRSQQNLQLLDSQLIRSETIFDRHRKESLQNKNPEQSSTYFGLLYISKMNIFVNVDLVIQGILNEGRFNLPEILKCNDMKMETAIMIVSKTYKQQINPELYHNIKNIIGIRNISNIFYGLFGIIQKPFQSYRDLNQIQPGLIDGINGAYTTITKEANNAKETILNISLGVKGVISSNYAKLFKGKWF